MENTMLTYKNHPIFKNGDLMYYGNMKNKHIIVLKVLEKGKDNDLEVATKVSIELQLNDPDISAAAKVQKSATRGSLFEALDIASIWLDRTLITR